MSISLPGRRALLFVGLLLSFALQVVHATVVAPPTIEQLVRQSDYVVRVVVKSAAPEWEQKQGNRHIVTRFEFEVREVIAGQPPAPLVLTMLGGRIGEVEMRVDGAPRFQVGDENILFVRGGNARLLPLVGLMYGQYPVVRDRQTGAAHVARSNGEPLRHERDVVKPLSRSRADPGAATAAAAAAPALTPEEFANRIRTVARNLGSTSAK